MMTADERRKAERVQTQLEASWEGAFSRRDGTIVDISSAGCFILTSDEVRPKELIRLEIQTPTGRRLYLWGEVVYQVHEMGFAVNFTGGDDTERRMLDMLVEYLREKEVAT